MTRAKDNSRRFVLRCAPLGLSSPEPLQIPDPIDWKYVIELADRWELTPLVGSALSGRADAVPGDTVDLIKQRAIESRSFSIVLAFEQAALVTALEREGIEVIALKGPALSALAYGDVSVRSASDIDLLVRPYDLMRARDVMLSQGFVRLYPSGSENALRLRGHALEFAKGKIKVELHSELFSRYLALTLDSETNLWNQAQTISCGGRQIRTLGPEHSLLFIAAHAAKHRWSRMKWVLDVAQLWHGLDKESVARAYSLAASCNAIVLFDLALDLASTTFGVPVYRAPGVKSKVSPKLLTGTLDRLGVTGDVFDGEPIPDDANESIETVLFWIQNRERLRDRMQILLRIAARQTGLEPLSRGSRLFRPVRLLFRGSRHILKRSRRLN